MLELPGELQRNSFALSYRDADLIGLGESLGIIAGKTPPGDSDV